MVRFTDVAKTFSTRHRIALYITAGLAGIALTGQLPTLMSLLASVSSLGTSTPVIFFTPHSLDPLTPGSSTDIDVRLTSPVPINAVGATITFDPRKLEIISISKEQSFFDLWTEDTVIREEAGEVHFSGGTFASDGFSGHGTMLTLRVRAKETGDAQISFSNAEIYAHDGRGRSLPNEKRSYTYHIELPAVSNAASPSILSAPANVPSPPSADFNGDGRVTLTDMSILAIQVLAPYNARFDLDQDGFVGLSDMSVFLSRMRR